MFTSSLKYIASNSLIKFFFLIPALTFVGCGQYTKNPSDSDSNDSDSINTDNPATGKFYHWPAAFNFSISQNFPLDKRSALFKAVKSWNTLIGCDFVSFGDEVNFSNREETKADGINAIMTENKADNWASSKQIAITSWIVNTESKQMQEADIFFNSFNFEFFDALALSNQVDTEMVALHELGHALGIEHADPKLYPKSVMVPSLHGGKGSATRDLGEYETEEIAKRYEGSCSK